MLDRSAALALLAQYAPEPYMRQHALSSEALMRALAARLGEDGEVWGLAGLLHDLDYAATKDSPDQHGLKAVQILAGKLPQAALDAIQAHNEMTGRSPQSSFDFALRAAETVTGLVSAAALMRPTGMQGMEVKSLKKKMKDKAFAANVSRERIRECERIPLPLDDFLDIAVKAMANLSQTPERHDA